MQTVTCLNEPAQQQMLNHKCSQIQVQKVLKCDQPKCPHFLKRSSFANTICIFILTIEQGWAITSPQGPRWVFDLEECVCVCVSGSGGN